MLSDRNIMPFSKRFPCTPKMNIYAVLGGRGLLVAGRRDDTVGCWRTGRGGHRPTMVCHCHPVFAIAIPCSQVFVISKFKPTNFS